MKLRRICVFGAGAIGGHLAAKLAAAGHQVSVVARGANLAAIRANGVALREGAQADAHTIEGRVRASDRTSDLGAQDVVFVTTKATALDAFAVAAAPLIGGADTSFVFVQNGIPWWYSMGLSGARPPPPDLSRLDPAGALARAIGSQRVIGAVVYSSNDLAQPGVIVNYTGGRDMLVLGEIDDRASERVAALRGLLTEAGMHSPHTGDIRQSVWDKLLLNFGSSLCVPLGEPVSALTADPALRAVRERIVAEGQAIARAHGVSLEDVPRRPGGVQSAGAIVNSAGAIVNSAGAIVNSAGATAHKPSMLQDYEIGRPMEVDAILAVPCAFARAAGVPAPTLEAVHALIARLAARKGLYSSP